MQLYGSKFVSAADIGPAADSAPLLVAGISVPYLSLFYATYSGPHARQLHYSSMWPEIVRRLAVGRPPPTPFSEGFVRNWVPPPSHPPTYTHTKRVHRMLLCSVLVVCNGHAVSFSYPEVSTEHPEDYIPSGCMRPDWR